MSLRTLITARPTTIRSSDPAIGQRGQRGAVAQAEPHCDTGLTLTNFYGASFPGIANFFLGVTDAADQMIWSREVSTP